MLKIKKFKQHSFVKLKLKIYKNHTSITFCSVLNNIDFHISRYFEYYKA